MVGLAREQHLAAIHPQKQGVLHLLALHRGEIAEDQLQGFHGAAGGISAPADLNHHIALRLLHFEDRADRPAPLGHQGIEAPGAADQTAHGARAHAGPRFTAAVEQGAVGGAVLASDAPHLEGVRHGVIQAADQVVDRPAGGIHQQQHRGGVAAARGGRGAEAQGHPPGLGRPIQIGHGGGVDREGMEDRVREAQQQHAQGGLPFELVGLLLAGSHHATTTAAKPMLRLQLLAEQRQQPRQIAGKAAVGKHQSQIGAARSGQLPRHRIHRPLQRHIPGQGAAAPGATITGEPGKGRKGHGRNLSPAGCTDNGA